MSLQVSAGRANFDSAFVVTHELTNHEFSHASATVSRIIAGGCGSGRRFADRLR